MGPGTSYQILRYKDAETVLRDPETFSSSINGEHIGQFMGDLILAMNGAEHRTYRNLVAKAFRASQLERWDETLVRPMIDRLLDEIAPLGRADLVESVTSVYPGAGDLRHRGRAARRRGAVRAVGGSRSTWARCRPSEGMAASQAMVDYLRPLVEARRAEPTGDFLSDLVHEEVDGEQLTDSKIYGFLRLLLPAGAETTFRVMGNCLHALLSHPDELARVYADRSLLPEVIEETLRWETSVTQVSRVATRDTEVAGCPIAAGSPVGVITASAQPRRDALGRRRRVAARPARAAPPRVRHRPAPVPRDAPRPARAAGRARPDPRSASRPAFRPRRASTKQWSRATRSAGRGHCRCCSRPADGALPALLRRVQLAAAPADQECMPGEAHKRAMRKWRQARSEHAEVLSGLERAIAAHPAGGRAGRRGDPSRRS